MPGSLPKNPYTDSAYHYGVDLFYFPDTLAAGACFITQPGDSGYPYTGWSAPTGCPGTIVILGHFDRSGWLPRVSQYGMIGFGKDTGSPLRDQYGDDSGLFVVTSPYREDE